MRYLADPRRQDLRSVMPSVRSVICAGLVYNTPFPCSTEATREPDRQNSVDRRSPAREAARAWISRYAWGTDYHSVMRAKLEDLRAAVEKLATGIETRVYVDTGPVLERGFARLSGIGWMGKNTCLINQQKGSWFFLGVVLTNLELELDLPAPDRCGSCTRCLEACPTGALVEPYVMDASRCIAYFNIELRGAIPEEFRHAIGNNVFGCDVCQDVCPWNSRPSSSLNAAPQGDAAGGEHGAAGSPQRGAAATSLPAFQPMQVEVKAREFVAEGSQVIESVPHSPATRSFSLFHPPLEALAAITEQDFRQVFARSPIKRAKYRGWLRNLCVVMGNSGDPQFIPWLKAAAGHSDPVVCEHAAWALRRLQGGL